MYCSTCSVPMKSMGVNWACGRCHARAVPLIRLKGTLSAQAWNWLRELASSADKVARIRCPRCRRYTRALPIHPEYGRFEVDLCTKCQLVWFDPGELDRVEFKGPRDDIAPEDSLIDVDLKPMAGEPNLVLASLVGLPYEEQGGHQKWGDVTLALALVIAIGSVYGFGHFEESVARYAFIPELAHQKWRWLSSFFLHAGWAHLIGNLYFFITFGDDVEEEIGLFRFVFLLGLSTIAGNLAVLLWDPSRSAPHLGASGGISGVMAFYAFLLPRSKLSLARAIIFPHPKLEPSEWLQVLRITLPAWIVFLIYLVLQFAGASLEMMGMSRTSYLSHIGGIAAGIAYCLLWQAHEKQESAEIRNPG